MEENISVIICDERKLPKNIIVPIYGTNDSTKKIYEQMLWNKKFSKKIWTEIVSHKIYNQKSLLDYLGIGNNFPIEIKENDISNMEARYADFYFHKLFGRDFIRFESDNINYALNYGYTILLSEMTRIITEYGYLTQIGVHHCNKNNNFNLSCDIVEPFRPLVDMVVNEKKNYILNREYKKDLIDVLNYQVIYKDKRYKLSYAMRVYFLDFVKSMKDNKNNLDRVYLFGR